VLLAERARQRLADTARVLSDTALGDVQA